MRYLARRLYYLPYDTIREISGKKHPYEPPKGRIFIGSGDFILQGKKQLEQLRRFTGLQPHHSVLDVGCGIGRTAVALTGYLDAKGSYRGFDIVRSGVRWCSRKITPDFPHFKFTHVPVGNDLYTAGRNDAQDFRFPYPNESFDIVFLFSVFTHMLPEEISNYLGEIRRTLRPNGRCLATFFLYNDDSEGALDAKKGFAFPIDRGSHRLMSSTVRSANVALHERHLMRLIEDARLSVDSVTHGYWNGAKAPENDFQDIVVMSQVRRLA